MATFQNTATKKAFVDNASSADTYIIDSAVKVFSLGGLSNGDTFAFDGFSSDYLFSFKSGVLTITNPEISGYKASIKLASTNGATAKLLFVDGDLTATVSKVGTKAATLKIGSDPITSKAAALSDAVLESVSGNGSVAIIDAASGQTGTAVVSGTPTFALASSASTVAEGSAVIYTLTTTNVAAGSVLGYTLTGTGSAAAVTSVGTFTVDASGRSAVAVTAPSNSVLGDTGTLVLKLNNGGATAGTVTVTDATVATAQTFTLTTGVDQFTGTSLNDTFNASVSNGVNTLSESDSLVGGAGTDTLNVQLAYGVTPSLSGIEIVTLTSTTATSSVSMDFQATSGVTQIIANAMKGPTTLSNITSPSTAVQITGTDQNSTVSYLASAVTGTADSAIVTLANVTAGTLTIGSGIETIALTVIGTDTVTLASSATAMTVGGAGALNLAGGTAVATIDAASNSGGISYTVLATAVTVTGGSGNDVITGSSSADVLTGNAGDDVLTGGGGNDTISGGAGNDTIRVSGAAGAAASLSGGDGNDTFVFAAAADATGAATIAGGAGNDTMSFTATESYTDAVFAKANLIETVSLSTGADTIVLGTAALAASITSLAGASGNDVITLSTAFTALTVNGGADSDTLTFGTFAQTVTVINVETIIANSLADTITVAGANTSSVEISAAAGNDTVTLGGTGAYSATVDGAGGNDVVTLSNTNTATFSVSVTNVETVTGSSANESITVAGTAVANVDAGAGTDTISVSGSVAHTLLGGDGNDTFVFAAAGGATAAATIAGGAGTDTMSFTATESYTDAVFAKANLIETVSLSTGADTIVLGTAALAAGITSLAGASGNDVITLSAAFTALTVNGGADSDTLTFGAFAQTVTVIDVESITGNTLADNVTIANTSVTTVTIDLGTGTDTVTVSHTFGGTIAASGVETLTGGAGADVVTGVSSVGTFDGGAGTDTYVFTTGDLNITVANVETLTGVVGVTSGYETVTISSANTVSIAMTDVSTIIGSSGNDVLTDVMTLTSTESVSVSLGDGDDVFSLSFTVNLASNSLTSTVSVFGGNGNDSITVTDAMTASGYVHYINGGAGADTIVGAASGVDVVQISLNSDLQSGVLLSLADRISGFQTLTDFIDLTGGTGALRSANETSLDLRTATGVSRTNADTFTAQTGDASVFSDLLSQAGSANLLLVNDVVSGSFTDQTSIDAGVTLITSTIGAAGSTAVGTKIVIVLNDSTTATTGGSDNAAIFLYTEAGTSGIQSSELKLIGVVTGAGDLSAATFN